MSDVKAGDTGTWAYDDTHVVPARVVSTNTDENGAVAGLVLDLTCPTCGNAAHQTVTKDAEQWRADSRNAAV